MARTSAKAKKSKQEVNKKKEEAKVQESKTGNESAGDSTDKENDSLNYDVEKIMHTRIFKGKRQYLVRWKGYNEDNDTWENESVLQSCKEVLDAFKKEHLANADSDDEGSEEGGAEKKEKTNKAETKKTKKNVKKAGKSSKQKKENEAMESDEESEEKEKDEVRGKNNEKSAEGPDEIEEMSKNKETKGKKRNAAKEAESSKAKKAKKVKAESDDESVTDGKDYEVEKILEVHTRKDGSHEFLIRWKGYKPSDDTWEPEAHLDCQDLIDKFMEKVEKAKGLTKKELRGNRTQTKRFVPLNSRIASKRSQRNSGFRPCYQETYED